MKDRTDPILTRDDILVGVEARTAGQVIGRMADHLHRRGMVHDTYGAAVAAREAAMPTGLPLEDGFAVAVPHTDPEHVRHAAIAVATLSHAVPFGSMDDPDTLLDVRLVFMLALRSKEEQLEHLTAVAALLQDGARLRALAGMTDPAEIQSRLVHDLNM